MEESVEPIVPAAKHNTEEWCIGNTFPMRLASQMTSQEMYGRQEPVIFEKNL